MNKDTGIQIALVWELMNGKLSDPAQELLLRQFANYRDEDIQKALKKCMDECKGRITPADIISRIDDGRPGVEEAWATVDRAHRDTNATIVWTEEMSAAYGIISNMVDTTAARMSFKDAYSRLCDESRSKCQPVKWTPSLGAYDGRSGPLLEAVRLGRLSPGRARNLVPELPPMVGEKPALPAPINKQLPPKEESEESDGSEIMDFEQALETFGSEMKNLKKLMGGSND